MLIEVKITREASMGESDCPALGYLDMDDPSRLFAILLILFSAMQ